LSTISVAMPCARNVGHDPPDLPRDQRRQPFSRFVEDQEIRIGHQRAADRQHLLLAAGKLSSAIVEALGEARKRRERALVGPVTAAVDARPRGHHEVLAHGEIREDPAPLGNVRDALPCDAKSVDAGHRAAPHAYLAVARLDDSSRLRMSVLLPIPLRPINPTVSPASMRKSTPCRMWLAP
jgi:hypothetical protein